MAIESTPEDVRLLLTLAAQNGLGDLREKFRDVYYRHDHPVVAYLSTVARLAYLEATLVRSFAESVGKPLTDAADLARDVKKMVAILQVQSGSMPKEEAEVVYRDLGIADALEQAHAQKASTAGEDEARRVRFAGALTDLNEALGKMQGDKEAALREMAGGSTDGIN